MITEEENHCPNIPCMQLNLIRISELEVFLINVQIYGHLANVPKLHSQRRRGPSDSGMRGVKMPPPTTGRWRIGNRLRIEIQEK